MMSGNHLVQFHDDAISAYYTSKYGQGFIFDIDSRDEMYLDHEAHPEVANPFYDYFEVGEEIMNIVEEMSEKTGKDLSTINSFLDFASGYGRFTRFIVQKVDPSRVTVSDIDRDAVDFCRTTFDVKGYYSMRNVKDCVFPEKYDMIVVISLFSHLSVALWKEWLVHLYEALENNGVLIFSTHGLELMERHNINAEEVEKGFFFIGQSETERLSKEDYGSAFITNDFVQSFIKKNELGLYFGYFPGRLLNHQDIFVIKKTRTREINLESSVRRFKLWLRNLAWWLNQKK